MPRDSALQAYDLTKHYGQDVAVEGVSFHLHPGTVTALQGPGGAGKTTTLRLILGLDRPTSGIATINGHRFAELAQPMRTVGAALDVRAVHPRRTAADQLLALARLGGVGRERVAQVLDIAGLQAVANQQAGRFSLDLKQRLGIAAALVGDPDILILDEPLDGLDDDSAGWMLDLVRGLADEGRIALFTSHLPADAERMSDRVLVIDHGRLLADVTVSEYTRTRTTTQAPGANR